MVSIFLRFLEIKLFSVWLYTFSPKCPENPFVGPQKSDVPSVYFVGLPSSLNSVTNISIKSNPSWIGLSLFIPSLVIWYDGSLHPNKTKKMMKYVILMFISQIAYNGLVYET